MTFSSNQAHGENPLDGQQDDNVPHEPFDELCVCACVQAGRQGEQTL